MTEVTACPTHFRLLSALRAIGPYLREKDSEDGQYLFDCLSVCVDDKKSPEEREFWGWWMELESCIEDEITQSFTANFKKGLYNYSGCWEAKTIPEAAQKEVARTQSEFMQKLSKVLEERFSLEFCLHEESAEFV
ncbi:sigma factor-binding protein Crl [Vibrio albus]|jgi:sigma factor-binding protein Crl|uniref:Sigma factor-binding protein Crl n=1 Tax=Vibrio albus TaxID=2200953 RepID=A0A2U3BCK6_9VIBR|nr:sigma factor-binding protein Crl [Vibrio albus]PWI34503.1 sigma factor-binding protein Crl [Vibrio albus]